MLVKPLKPPKSTWATGLWGRPHDPGAHDERDQLGRPVQGANSANGGAEVYGGLQDLGVQGIEFRSLVKGSGFMDIQRAYCT